MVCFRWLIGKCVKIDSQSSCVIQIDLVTIVRGLFPSIIIYEQDLLDTIVLYNDFVELKSVQNSIIIQAVILIMMYQVRIAKRMKAKSQMNQI